MVVAVGSQSRVPDLPGLDQIPYWTNREGTSASELPKSLLILGGGPTGVEAGPGLRPLRGRSPSSSRTLGSGPRPSAELRDPHRCAREGRRYRRTGVRAVRFIPPAEPTASTRLRLNDGSRVEGHAVMLAIGRSFPLEGWASRPSA